MLALSLALSLAPQRAPSLVSPVLAVSSVHRHHLIRAAANDVVSPFQEQDSSSSSKAPVIGPLELNVENVEL
eukprot:637846-Prymnesium_polylepis.1